MNKIKAEQAAADKAQAELKAQEQHDEIFVKNFVRKGISEQLAKSFRVCGFLVYNISQFPSDVIKIFNEISPHLVYPQSFVFASNYGETFALETKYCRDGTMGLGVYIYALTDHSPESYEYDEYHYLHIVFLEDGRIGLNISCRSFHTDSDYLYYSACDMSTFKEYWSHVNTNTFYDAVARAIDDAKKAQPKKRGLFW